MQLQDVKSSMVTNEKIERVESNLSKQMLEELQQQKEEIKVNREGIVELNKKIESEIGERRNLAERLKKLQEEVNTLKVENAELKARPIKTYAEVTEGVLAGRWRQKNVILIGVKENDSEDLYDMILKIAREVGIDLDLSEVSNAIRLGKPNPQIVSN